MNDFTPLQAHTIFSHAFIAVFGGIVHALNAHRTGSSKGIGDFVALTVMSSFSGVVFALIAVYLFDSQYITMAVAGSGGFLGIEGLSTVAKKVQQLIANKL